MHQPLFTLSEILAEEAVVGFGDTLQSQAHTDFNPTPGLESAEEYAFVQLKCVGSCVLNV